MNDIVPISSEALEVANSYLVTGDIVATANELSIPPDQVASVLQRKEIRTYVDQVFLDQGYRNRHKLHNLLDTIIDSKVEEAAESEVYTKKDLVDLIALVHKMRQDEMKSAREAVPHVQVNQQFNDGFGEGNYGKLIRELIENA